MVTNKFRKILNFILRSVSKYLFYSERNSTLRYNFTRTENFKIPCCNRIS
ncbi:hypothetical protein CAMGR0001_0287 [Campylobacter gracilis RM3268]|uniref:Uncharacterized protein n=1 Tax=Campylobacter gracilis RM3268 TaxID=553220 RepID=C8PKR4_9BACT|nr:hypothetical protein CAMGR0001_0287 [Campylobacter gracilis RM3268]